jgi:hypothetical protein
LFALFEKEERGERESEREIVQKVRKRENNRPCCRLLGHPLFANKIFNFVFASHYMGAEGS